MIPYVSDITSISSKGQVVLPVSIRKEMDLQTGTKFMVFCDGDCILLKPIMKPDISDFRNLMDAAQQWTAEAGITEDDINDAIKTVRARKKASK